MVDLARRAIPDSDVVCFVVDISAPPSRLDDKIAAQVRRARAPKVLVLNKVDIKVRGENHLEAYRALGEWDMELAISARTGIGLEALVDELVARLPVAPPPYPTDQVADQSERQLAAELVREKVLRYTDQEVPHAVAVEVDEWEERENATYIRMTVNVEKDSQKGIVIGAGGAMLKRIGTAAREDIERALGKQVFLELWVKARPNWRDDPSSLGWLGYNVKDWS
jgi:GTP-binding protein Era